jgi:hypothetical protein
VAFAGEEELMMGMWKLGVLDGKWGNGGVECGVWSVEGGEWGCKMVILIILASHFHFHLSWTLFYLFYLFT